MFKYNAKRQFNGTVIVICCLKTVMMIKFTDFSIIRRKHDLLGCLYSQKYCDE